MKGLCCFAQQQGDLGKPLVVTVHRKDGTTFQRCGVCEVVPSCRNPQKTVFAFRFLKSIICRLPGKTACVPTSAGIAQYNAQRSIAAIGGERTGYVETTGTGGPFGGIGFEPIALPGGTPYTLPLS